MVASGPINGQLSCAGYTYHISPAEFPVHLPLVRQLFLEYEKALGISLSFQGFEQEISALPGEYTAPSGGCWLAWRQEIPTGCVALRLLKNDIAEVKRLFVRPEAAGKGIGRQLMQTVITAAREGGYKYLWLDTLSHLNTAIALYNLLGFVEIPPYGEAKRPDIRYFGLPLR